VGTHELLRFLGQKLPGRGVLQTAAKLGVPVYIPAFTDSELGLDFAVHLEARRRLGRQVRLYDGFRDLVHFREMCAGVIADGRKLGIFTVGGGVPRNWAQQVGPYADIRHKRMQLEGEGEAVRYCYGIRICPDPVHYGHLSGCTYSEGVSWGKFIPRSEGGRYAEILLDATVGWPLLAQALIDRDL
ncbi:MAG: deoxyhypusine synthase family protein, partial [Phycisphaerales bacterium]|nr:deoxyhypusine synthase family protein [Phycisphaerales bacterium]